MKPTRLLKTFNLIALTVIVGFIAGVVLNRALRTIRTPQDKPVAQLIRDLQRKDSTLTDLGKNLWMILPEAVTTSFPSLTPNSAVTIRREAAEELSRRGPEAKKAVPTLAAALADSDFRVRMAAVQALDYLGPLAEASVPDLIRFFKDDTNNIKPSVEYLSGQTLLALARIAPRDPRVIALACESLQSQTSLAVFPPSQLPSFAVDSLAVIAQSTNSVISVLIAELGKSGINFDDILANLRPHPAPFDPPLAGNQGTPLPDRNQNPAAPSQNELAALQKKFQQQYDQITLSAHIISALGKIGPKTPDVIPAIVAALKSRHDGIRLAAVDALGNIGAAGAETVPVLLEILAETPKLNTVRRYTLNARPSDEPAAPELQWSPNPPSANSPAPPVVLNNAVKMQTAMLLRYGLPPSTPRPFGLRPRIIQTLGKIGPAAAAALPALTAECQDRTSPWRYDAALARRHIDGRTDEARAVLRDGLRNEASWARRKAVEMLAQLGAEALPELIEALTNIEMQVRGVSVTALGELGPAARASAPMLEQALSDRKATIRLAAKRALQRIQPDHPALLSSNSPPATPAQSAR